MKKATKNQQQKTHSKTTKDSHNQEQVQTQDKELLNLKVDKGEKKKMTKSARACDIELVYQIQELIAKYNQEKSINKYKQNQEGTKK